MQERLCSIHEDDIISVCFFEGCNQHLLCQECIKCHPDHHNANTKSIISLMRKDDWIRLNEKQRDSQISQLRSIYKEKDSQLCENQEKLQRMIDEIIEYLKKRLLQWAKLLDSSLEMMAKPDNKESFAKIEDILDRLADIDFRKGDIYDQVEKVKLFNESILPESTQLSKQYQGVPDKDRIRIDQDKIDAYKQEIFKLVNSIHLKDFLTGSVSVSISNLKQVTKQLEMVKQESEILVQDNTQTLPKPHEETQMDSKGQSNQLVGLNQHYQQNFESLTVTNQKLQDQLFKLRAGLDSLVETKLNLQTELEALKTAHKDLIKKHPKIELLSEDSIIIQNKDLDHIRSWIKNPSSSDGPLRCKLNLLYRGTRDGFTCEAFYKQTANKAPTISFVKSRDHRRVFGGYTTREWKLKSGDCRDTEAFLFSLTHGEKYPVIKPSYAMSGRENCLLSFGYPSYPDLQIAAGCDNNPSINSTTFPYYYQCSKFNGPDGPGAREYLAGSKWFTVEEIEVYQVVWS